MEPPVLRKGRYAYVHDVKKGPPEVIDAHHIIVARSSAGVCMFLKYALIGIICLVTLLHFQTKCDSTILWSLTVAGLLLRTLLRKQVEKESVFILPAFGVQLETLYRRQWKVCIGICTVALRRKKLAISFVEMAASDSEGQVIGCHTVDSWNQQLHKGNDNKKLIVVDFTASWCGPCRIIAPFFADLAKKLPNVMFVKVDVDELKSVASDWAVEAMPTFVLIKEGKILDRVVGAKKEELQLTISKHMA